MKVTRLIYLIVLTATFSMLPALAARADGSAQCIWWGCSAKAKGSAADKKLSEPRTSDHDVRRRTSADGRKKVGGRQEGRNREADEYRRKLNSAITQYKQQMADRSACLASAQAVKCQTDVVQPGQQPLPLLISEPGSARRAATQRSFLTPTQVAYIAVARLRLTAPQPGIGPPPSINRWKMAAVGYPLWLWGEGATDPAPVSDSVGGLYVSLDAHISMTVFNMGDGTTVTCQGSGKKWGHWVDAGAKSPSCGHVYTKTSPPESKYTVTATTYWSVAWNVIGRTGVIPFVQSSSTSLPVGELQALVR